MAVVLSYGHGTATKNDIIKHLESAGVDALFDVRSYPGSRHNPHVGRRPMASWLPRLSGITYRWEPRLGGRRKPSMESRFDTVWRNESFRSYAGYMRSAEFLAGIDALLTVASKETTVFMCSESVWWRCHRRMIADFLVVARQWTVCHIMHDESITEHVPTDGIRLRDDGLIVYDQPNVKVSVK